MHLNPAELAIHAFGGVRPLARLLGRDPAAVSRWRKSGWIPAPLLAEVYQRAQVEGLDLTAEDLILGAELEDEPRHD